MTHQEEVSIYHEFCNTPTKQAIGVQHEDARKSVGSALSALPGTWERNENAGRNPKDMREFDVSYTDPFGLQQCKIALHWGRSRSNPRLVGNG